jgi:tetratricopeptide (TPR) repeat protein
MNFETKELLERGKQHFESKNYPRAEQIFVKVLRAGSRFADILNMLGVIYHVEGKFNNAIESFEEALEINPNYTEATLNLAILYNDLGEYKKAKGLYSQVRKRGASDLDPILKGKIANMHANLGDTYRSIGRYIEAAEEYKKALKLCPIFVDIQTKLGISYRENGQKELAVKEFTQAIDKKPSYLPAQIQLGVTLYAGGQKDKAAKAWEGVLKKDKENQVAKIYLRLCKNGNKSKKK